MLLFSEVLWAFAIVAFLASLYILSSNVFLWWKKYRVLAHYCAKIPQYKLRPFITYLQILKQAYKSGNVFWFQITEAGCYVARKEGIYMFWVGFKPFVLLFKADMIESLVKDMSNISKAEEYNFLTPWIGTGLLTSTDEKWRKHRKLLTPCFHFKILENFIPIFNEHAEMLTRKMELEVGKTWTNIEPMIIQSTLSILCETVMGVCLNTQTEHGKEYVENIDKMGEFIFHRLVRPWLWSDPIFFHLFPSGWQYKKTLKSLHDFTRKIIKQKKAQMVSKKESSMTEDNTTKRKKAFLEFLLECHLQDESFTEENIKEEVDTFMFEGHDTTASGIKWTLYLLGHHPDIQEKVYQELESISQSECGVSIDYEDLMRMKYLDCVIKESFRLYPPVFFMGRQLKTELKVGDYTLMPGCSCIAFIYFLHRDPEVFPNPECFDPDRFLPENSNNRHPYAYVPFSAGPRNCIGQKFAVLELKTVLAYVLRKFKLTSLDPRDKINMTLNLTLKSLQPIRINFEPRR